MSLPWAGFKATLLKSEKLKTDLPMQYLVESTYAVRESVKRSLSWIE